MAVECSRRLVQHMRNSADQIWVSSVAARSGNCWWTEAVHENWLMLSEWQCLWDRMHGALWIWMRCIGRQSLLVIRYWTGSQWRWRSAVVTWSCGARRRISLAAAFCARCSGAIHTWKWCWEIINNMFTRNQHLVLTSGSHTLVLSNCKHQMLNFF